jgi:hypothetical protein
MKKSVIFLLVTTLVLSISTSAFARGGHHRGGGNFNPWPLVGAGLVAYTGVQVIDRVFGGDTRQVVVVQPQQPVYYGGQIYQPENSCNGSYDYCRGLAEAQRRRIQQQRQLDYQRGLRDGGY